MLTALIEALRNGYHKSQQSGQLSMVPGNVIAIVVCIWTVLCKQLFNTPRLVCFPFVLVRYYAKICLRIGNTKRICYHSGRGPCIIANT